MNIRYFTSPRESIQPITVEIFPSYRLNEMQIETREEDSSEQMTMATHSTMYLTTHVGCMLLPSELSTVLQLPP